MIVQNSANQSCFIDIDYNINDAKMSSTGEFDNITNERKSFMLFNKTLNTDGIKKLYTSKSVLGRLNVNTQGLDFINGNFYAQFNNTISNITPGKPEQYIEFNLNRIKYNCRLYYTTNTGTKEFLNIPSEIIDVSISHFGDYKNKLLYSQKKTYEFISSIGRQKYKAPSMEGIINDLGIILFSEKMPWEDVKYAKRIKRIFLVCFIDMLTMKTDIPDTEERIINRIDKLNKIKQILRYTNKNEFQKTINSLPNFNSYLFYTFFNDYFSEIFAHIPGNESLYNEFIKTIEHELDIFIGILYKMSESAKIQGAIRAENSIVGSIGYESWI